MLTRLNGLEKLLGDECSGLALTTLGMRPTCGSRLGRPERRAGGFWWGSLRLTRRRRRRRFGRCSGSSPERRLVRNLWGGQRRCWRLLRSLRPRGRRASILLERRLLF